MAFLKKDKKYGLTIPKQGNFITSKLGKSASIFQDDSSEEDESKKKLAINLELNAVAEKKKQTKQTKEDMERALQEDPNVYKYDEIYEEMEQKKIDFRRDKKETDKKPKYIANLLKSAAVRKREQERRIERGVQKERENEGDQFADKESFVTAAYRQKMLDQAEEENRLQKQDEVDAQNDVMKQKDLSQFYRNLLNRNVAMGAAEKPEVKGVERSKDEEVAVKHERPSDTHSYKDQNSLEGEEVSKRQKSSARNISYGSDEGEFKVKGQKSRGVREGHGTQKRAKSSETSESSELNEDVSIENRTSSRKGIRSRPKADASYSESDTSDEQHKKVRSGRNHPRTKEVKDKAQRGSQSRSYKDEKDSRKESSSSRYGRERRRRRSYDEESSSDVEMGDERIKDGGKNYHDKGVNVEREKGISYGVHKAAKDSRHEGDKERRHESERDRRQKEDKDRRHREDKNRGRKEDKDSEHRTDKDRRSKADDDVPHRAEGRKYRDEDKEIRRFKEKKRKKDIPEGEETLIRDIDEDEKTRQAERERRKQAGRKNDKKEKDSTREESLKIFEKRNDKDGVLSAKERYLARKKARIVPETHEDESDG